MAAQTMDHKKGQGHTEKYFYLSGVRQTALFIHDFFARPVLLSWIE